MNDLNVTFVNNLAYIFIAVGIILAILTGLTAYLAMELSNIKKRYRKITLGADDSDLKQILLEHADKITVAVDEGGKLRDDVDRIDGLMRRAITRIAVVRYNAFHDDTADLSYSIALLDDDNSGVIISSLNGREFTRSYVKPIVRGESERYKLTKEELQAIHDAAIPPEQRNADEQLNQE